MISESGKTRPVLSGYRTITAHVQKDHEGTDGKLQHSIVLDELHTYIIVEHVMEIVLQTVEVAMKNRRWPSNS